MKLKREFIVHEADGETMLIPTGGASFSGVVKGNRTLGAILEQLKENTTEEAIIDALKARYDGPADAIAADVKRAIESLRKIKALDE